MWYRIPVSGHYQGHTLSAVYVNADSTLDAGRILVDTADRNPDVADLEILTTGSVTVVPVPPVPDRRSRICYEQAVSH